MHISVVSPVYKAPKILPELVQRLERSLSEITDSFEVILVDDGCPWDSWSVVEELAQKYTFVRGLKLSRNFGQHYAITAGLDHAKGDWVVVMDCDLQDQPEEIIKLHQKALEGYEIVFARRVKRMDDLMKKSFSKLFYKIFTYLSGLKQDETIANFGIYSNIVIKHIKHMREPMRAFTPMVRWVGFTTSTVDVKHSERYEGVSTYNFSKLLNLALEISISYSDKPLKLAVKLGVFTSLISLVLATILVYRYMNGSISVIGYTSIIVSICFFSGLIIMILGILGLYISKIFDGIKNRPIYIIHKRTNQ
jgi:glycosyltransferase involved in cell wall biosynthesis